MPPILLQTSQLVSKSRSNSDMQLSIEYNYTISAISKCKGSDYFWIIKKISRCKVLKIAKMSLIELRQRAYSLNICIFYSSIRDIAGRKVGKENVSPIRFELKIIFARVSIRTSSVTFLIVDETRSTWPL